MGVKAQAQFTIVDFNDITPSATAPSSPSLNQLWLDTSVIPDQLKKWDGTSWDIVNDVNVGGRNLLKSSNTTVETGWSNEYTAISTLSYGTDDGNYVKGAINANGTMSIYKNIGSLMSKTLDLNKEYTISAEFKTNGVFPNGLYIRNNAIVQPHEKFMQSVPNTNGTWQRVSITFKFTKVFDNILIDLYGAAVSGTYIMVRNYKIEEGNKATDWTPAPEDIQDQIDTTVSRVSSAEQKITPDAIVSTVSKSVISSTTVNTKVAALDANISRVGTGWTEETNVVYTDGSGIYSNVINDYIEYTFIGTGIEIDTLAYSNRGKIDITVDGGAVTTFDAYLATMTKVVAYSKTDLAYGQHKVKVKINGTKNASSTGYTFVLDFIRVFNTTVVNNSNVISQIRQSAESVGIQASKIEISGVVTLSNLLHPNDNTKIDGGDIYTGSITATQLSVAARNLVYNFSNQGLLAAQQVPINWTSGNPLGCSIDKSQTVVGVTGAAGRAVDSLLITTNATNGHDISLISSSFDIDPNKTYKVSLMVKSASLSSKYFGLTVMNAAGANIGVYPFTVGTKTMGTALDTNPYFWSISKQATAGSGWVLIEGYVCATGTTMAEMPYGANAVKHFIFPPDAAKMQIRFLNYNSSTSYGDGVTSTAYFYNPTVTPVDSGTIYADRIVGGTLTLGGASNGNGLAKIKDASGNDMMTLDNSGILIQNGKLRIQDSVATGWYGEGYTSVNSWLNIDCGLIEGYDGNVIASQAEGVTIYDNFVLNEKGVWSGEYLGNTYTPANKKVTQLKRWPGNTSLVLGNGQVQTLTTAITLLTSTDGLSIDAGSAMNINNPSIRITATSQLEFPRGISIPSTVGYIYGTVATYNTNSMLRLSNAAGYIDIGPGSTSYAHFYTDRPKFYFDKAIWNNQSYNYYGGNSFLSNTGIQLSSVGNVYIEMRSENGNMGYMDWSKNGSEDYNMRIHNDSSNQLRISGGTLRVDGAIVGVSKSAVTMTPSYGEVTSYCDESPNHIFIDRGYGITDEDGICYVMLDPVFLETVNTSTKDYWVHLTSFEEGDVKLRELEQDYFIVKGTPNTRFIWRVDVERFGYEKLRWNDANIQF